MGVSGRRVFPRTSLASMNVCNRTEFAAANLPALETRTRRFAAAIRESTIPPATKDAATDLGQRRFRMQRKQ
jgi:hypothetical protein